MYLCSSLVIEMDVDMFRVCDGYGAIVVRTGVGVGVGDPAFWDSTRCWLGPGTRGIFFLAQPRAQLLLCASRLCKVETQRGLE